MGKKTRLAFLLALLGAAATACSDESHPARPGPQTAPFEPVAFFDHAPAPGMDVLRRTVPLPHDVSETVRIGPDGGRIKLFDAGIYVGIPPGALDEEIDITLTAFAGDRVAFEFAPHGTTFARALKIGLDVVNTEAEHLLYESPCRNADQSLCDYLGVYYDGDGSVGGVTTLETFPVFLNSGGKLWFWTDHFSGYALAT